MSFQEKSRRVKFGIIGSVVLPLLYIISLIIYKDLDFIIFTLGPLGSIVWAIQWVGYFMGGWVLAVIASILFFALAGYLLGCLIGWFMGKVNSRT